MRFLPAFNHNLGDALRQGLRRYRRGLGSLGRRPEPRRRAASPGEGQAAWLPRPWSKAEGPAGGQNSQHLECVIAILSTYGLLCLPKCEVNVESNLVSVYLNTG